MAKWSSFFICAENTHYNLENNLYHINEIVKTLTTWLKNNLNTQKQSNKLNTKNTTT